MFHGGWFLTGDYARRDADGYLWFLGRQRRPHQQLRLSRLAVRGRARAEGSIPPSPTCAAVGEEVGAGTKLLVAAYVIAAARRDARRRTRCSPTAREHLAAYKAPRIVYLVDDFPRTRNGKVLRRALRPDLARA